MEWIERIRNVPRRLESAVDGLNESQLDTHYRKHGWTVRQVVHHVADSHVNAYIRFRLALTEDKPTIKPYDEAKWAKLSGAGPRRSFAQPDPRAPRPLGPPP